MAQTTQPHKETDISFNCYKAVKEAKADARENLQIVNSLSNSMNKLCTNLDRLDSFMENFIFCIEKEKSSPQAEPFE